MTDVTFRQLVLGLRQLGFDRRHHIVAHASLSSFGRVRGGPQAVAAALCTVCGTVVMPGFTYQTLVVPPTGPLNNGIDYSDYEAKNAYSEFWRPDLPVHRTIGAIPEALRQHREAWRSEHPVLSFIAVGEIAVQVTMAQKLDDPLAPLDVLTRLDGHLVLLGVGLTRAAVIHHAERKAGRRGFMRWALTTQLAAASAQGKKQMEFMTRRMNSSANDADAAHPVRTPLRQLLYSPPNQLSSTIREIPNYPGCSDGFGKLAPHIAALGRSVQIGEALVWRYPLAGVVEVATKLIKADPTALLCDDSGCERCTAVRLSLQG